MTPPWAKTTDHPILFEDSEWKTLAQRLAFLQMTEVDRQRLRAFGAQLNASSDAFVEQFYRHLFSFKETARFLEDPELVARLKHMQQVHFRSMLEDDINDEYIARRRRVGDVHAHIGISPQMFLGTYNQYLQYGLRELASAPDLPIADFVEQTLSLLKAVFLDVELTLDAYFAEATQNLRQGSTWYSERIPSCDNSLSLRATISRRHWRPLPTCATRR